MRLNYTTKGTESTKEIEGKKGTDVLGYLPKFVFQLCSAGQQASPRLGLEPLLFFLYFQEAPESICFS